jgi:hypothetical protein
MTDRSIDSEDQPGEPPGVRLDEQAGSIGIVADGWWCLADTASYYPEDLPADWQLGYFANEHEGVYIDLAHWRTRLAESLHNWAADVHRGFRFYLEHPTVTDPAVHPGTGLGTHLGGFIRWSDAGTGRVLTPVDPDADAEQQTRRLEGSAIFDGIDLDIARGRQGHRHHGAVRHRQDHAAEADQRPSAQAGRLAVIVVDGQDVKTSTRPPRALRLRTRMGMLFQSGALLTDLTCSRTSPSAARARAAAGIAAAQAGADEAGGGRPARRGAI